jgi:hypothetical protein
MKKDFKYSVRIRKTGKLLVEEIVTFGTEEYPFPEDWENSGIALQALENYKESMTENHFEISYSEFDESEEPEEADRIYSSKDCIDFALWLRANDTPDSAEEFFGFTDSDMFEYWIENIKNKVK